MVKKPQKELVRIADSLNGIRRDWDQNTPKFYKGHGYFEYQEGDRS